MIASRQITVCLVLAAALACVAVAADDPPKPEVHPAFRPVAQPKVPAVKGNARTDVDRFVLAALEARRLALNPEADRTTLIRRVCFDLTGLPPEPEAPGSGSFARWHRIVRKFRTKTSRAGRWRPSP